MKRMLSVLITALLICGLLSGCGSSYSGGAGSAADSNRVMSAPEAEYYYAAEEGWYDDIYDYADTPAQYEGTKLSGEIPETLNLKIIYTADISMESTEFDAAVTRLSELVRANGGWFESSRQDNNDYYYGGYRTANYTIRIPSQNFYNFCDNVGELCKIKSIYRSAEDISEMYYDTEARLQTQRTKRERLQTLLEQAEDMEDIITLESAISDTDLIIENLTGSLRKYDSLVGYATVSVRLSEVYQITETEEPAIGFEAKLAAAFRAGTGSFVTGVQEFVLAFARSWASWLLFLAVVLLIVFLASRASRRRRERNEGRRTAAKRRKKGKAVGNDSGEEVQSQFPAEDEKRQL